MVHTPNHPYAPVQFSSVPSPRTRPRYCSLQPSTPNVAIEHNRPPSSSETLIKRIRLATGNAGPGAGAAATSENQYSGSSSSKEMTDVIETEHDHSNGNGHGNGNGKGNGAGAGSSVVHAVRSSGSGPSGNGHSPSSSSSVSFPSGPYLFDLYDLPVTLGEKQVVDPYEASMSYYHKPTMARSFTTEMNEQTSYPSYSKSAAASAVSAPSAPSSSGPAFDTVRHSFHPDVSPPSSPPTSPSALSSSSSNLSFDLADWNSLEAHTQWNAFVEHASLIHPSMIRRSSELQSHQSQDFGNGAGAAAGTRRNSRTIIEGLDTLMEERQQNIPLRIDVTRSTSGTMDSIFPKEEEQTQLHSLTESMPPTPSSSASSSSSSSSSLSSLSVSSSSSSITAICPYPQLQVAPSPAELPIGQLARFLSTGGKEMRMEQEIEMLKQENAQPPAVAAVAALSAPSVTSTSVSRLIEEQTSTGIHTRRASGSRRASLLAIAPTAAAIGTAEAASVPSSPLVKVEKGKPGRKRSSAVAFPLDMMAKTKAEKEQMMMASSIVPSFPDLIPPPLPAVASLASPLESNSFLSSLFSTLPSTTTTPLLSSALVSSTPPAVSTPPKRQKKAHGRPSSSAAAASSSLPSSPTHSPAGAGAGAAAGKPQKDRHVKTAKKLKPVQEGGVTNPVEVVPFYYSRPTSVQSALPSSLIAEPPTASTPPNTRVYKIRLITVENATDGRRDVYVHGADIGGLVERKSNISRLFGKFDSPSEKLLMNVVGTHNNLTGQESNILTVKGIWRFLKTPKMRDQEHYKQFIVDELLPKMKELSRPPTANRASSQSLPVGSAPVSAPALAPVAAPSSMMIGEPVPSFSLNPSIDSIPSLIKDELTSVDPQMKAHPQGKSSHSHSHHSHHSHHSRSHSHSHSHSPSHPMLSDTLSPAPATPVSPPSEVDDDDEDDLSDISSVASSDSNPHSSVHTGFSSPIQAGRR